MKIKRQATDACLQCQVPQHCFVADMMLNAKKPMTQEAIFLKKGEILYRQQEKFQSFFVLKVGIIQTYWLNEQGRHTISDFYLPGELLAFSSLNTHYYVENAQALREAELCRIPLSLLMSQVNEEQQDQIAWFHLLSASLNRVEKARYRYINTSAAQKVAIFLVDYAERLMKAELANKLFSLLPTQQDIANYLGLTAETLSRVMSHFQQQGLVQFTAGKQVADLDYAKLQTLIMTYQGK